MCRRDHRRKGDHDAAEPEPSNTIRSLLFQAARPLGETAPVVFGVGIDFPGETSLAPDIAVLDLDAQPRGKRYVYMDVVAAIEVVSTKDDIDDYVTKVAKYSRFGIETYLIVDPFSRMCSLYEGAGADGYGEPEKFAYGETITLSLADGREFTIGTSGFPAEEAARDGA